MQYIRIRNFERFQHYRDRRPPWIKLYKDLWNDPNFFELSEIHRYFLLGLFVIASQNDNKIPNREKWLQRELSTTKPLPIEQLIKHKWLEIIDEPEAETITPRGRDASNGLGLARSRETEGETETEGEREIPLPPFTLSEPKNAPAEKRRPPDEAFETFKAIFDERKVPAKYPLDDTAGFVQLAKVRKDQGTPARASPPMWRRACENYLDSPREKHTLADLCTHYPTFMHSRLDRYGKPEEKGNGAYQGNGLTNSGTVNATHGGARPYKPKQ